MTSLKFVVDKMMLTLRNFQLYPENHSLTIQSMNDCLMYLGQYVNQNGFLRLQVNKTQFLHENEVVFQGESGDENPAYQLYRDGIEWLEFNQGLTRDEFLEFLKIIKQHGSSRTNEEYDIVTALWEADFTHISYHTTDLFWKDDPIIDFDQVRVIDPDQKVEEAQKKARLEEIKSAGNDGVSVFLLATDEIKQTMDMVREEELRNHDVDIFDVLLIILKEQKKEDDFQAVLDIITESFKNTLERCEFSAVSRFYDKLEELNDNFREKKSWALPYLEDFILNLSGKKVLESLHRAWPDLDEKDEAQLDTMVRALCRFSPQAVSILCPMILGVASSHIQNLLIRVIGFLAEKDSRPLIKLLSHQDEKVVHNAIFILGNIEGEKVTQSLIRKYSTSTGWIRQDVVKSLVRRKTVPSDLLIQLVEDSDPAIRTSALERMGKAASPAVEAYLIDRISKHKYKKEDLPFLFKLYKALGGCGSSSAEQFLFKQQKVRNWFKNPVRAGHQKGAGMALNMIRNENQ